MSFFDEHETVLATEACEQLAIKADGVYIDGTFGRGGHSKRILEALSEEGKLLSIDKDADAIKWGAKKFKDDNRIECIQNSFACIGQISKDRNLVEHVNGVLLDIGVSNPQLSDPNRGFSFMRDGPLDMRMDQTKGVTAKEWINAASKEDIAHVIWKYGEEKGSRKIAAKIVEQRAIKPFETTKDLAKLCENFIKKQRIGKHPATKVFQAIRIWINKELEELELGLEEAFNVLAPNGRLVVISFHSLEDRIVKNFMRSLCYDNISSKVPLKADEIHTRARLIGRKIKPSESEINRNQKARSAVMRVLEKK